MSELQHDFADGRDWPDWAFAIISAIHHMEVRLLSQQDQINADVALLQDALTGIGKELQDYQAAIAAQAPQLDLSGLDAIAQKALSLVPPTASAPTDTPTADPTADVQAAASGDAPADPTEVNPAPTL